MRSLLARLSGKVLLDGAILGAWLALTLRQAWFAEDAFIALRFSRNWAEGAGPVFNPGMPPVEGYSDFLWVALGAVVHVLGLNPLIAMCVVSCAAAVWTILAVRRVGRDHLGLTDDAARAAMLVLAACLPFSRWSTSGLEVLPQTLAFFLAATGLAFDDRPGAGWRAGIAGLVLTLLRTEGVLWSPVLMALAGGLRLWEGRPVRPVLTRYLLVVGVGFGAWYAWRLGYYGTWLPNPTLAKVEMTDLTLLRGLRYVALFALMMVTPLAVPVGLWMAARSGSLPRAAWLTLAVLAVPAWAVLVGGDYMALFRFLVPGLPFMALALGWLMQGLALRAPAPITAVLSAVIMSLGAAPLADLVLFPERMLVRMEMTTADKVDHDQVMLTRGRFRTIGANRQISWEALALGAFARPGEVVATAAIGEAGYRNPDLLFLDLCGLVDRQLALRPPRMNAESRPGHEHCVPPKIVLDRRPDIIIFEQFYGVRDPADTLERRVREYRPWLGDDPYYPDFVAIRAEVEGGVMFGFGMRRAATEEDRKKGWEEWREKIAWLRTQPPLGAGGDS